MKNVPVTEALRLAVLNNIKTRTKKCPISKKDLFKKIQVNPHNTDTLRQVIRLLRNSGVRIAINSKRDFFIAQELDDFSEEENLICTKINRLQKDLDAINEAKRGLMPGTIP